MAQFPWKKGNRAPTYGDLTAEMSKRFGDVPSPNKTGNVQTMARSKGNTKPRTVRVVGKTGYPTGPTARKGTVQTAPPSPPRRLPEGDSARDWGGELAKEYWKRGHKKF